MDKTIRLTIQAGHDAFNADNTKKAGAILQIIRDEITTKYGSDLIYDLRIYDEFASCYIRRHEDYGGSRGDKIVIEITGGQISIDWTKNTDLPPN